METTFCDLPFTIAPGRVFTPRPATERLVGTTHELIDDGPKRVADVGTGSGVIAVCLAKRNPEIEVWAARDHHARRAPIALVRPKHLAVHKLRIAAKQSVKAAEDVRGIFIERPPADHSDDIWRVGHPKAETIRA